MKSYLEILRVPGVARIIVAQLVARIPAGMLSLGVLIHIERLFDSYAAAGVVLAALSLGQAVAGPLTSRWLGRWGMRPVLLATTVVCSIALAVIALAPLALVGYLFVAAIAGLSMPPVQPAVRTIYPKLVNGKQLSPLFSLDASAQELIWIGGPVIVTVVATQVSTVAGILLPVAFLTLGGAWFIASPELGRVRVPPSTRGMGRVLSRPPLLMAVVVSILMIGSCGAIEAAVVATFGDHGGGEAGIIIGIWALGSLTGGLVFGHLAPGPWSQARRLLVILIGCMLAALAWDFWTLAVALLVAGLFIAPTLGAMSSAISVSMKFSETAEAYGWVGTGGLLGAGLGAALAGVFIDQVGPAGGFWVSVTLAAAAVLVAAVFHRALPDLRGRDATPLPDTAPVPIQPR
jgi:MFS family permease